MLIYVIENKINGKRYVGQTITDLNHRFQRGHLSEARTGRRNAPLYNAIRKYGEDNFKASVLEECFSQKELNEREKHWIQKFGTLVPSGYNLLDGGGSKAHKQETKDKISKIRRKQIAEGLVAGFTGKSHSEKTRRILAEKSQGNQNAKGQVRNLEWKEKQRQSHLGKKHTKEHKRKISESLKGENNPNYGKRASETSRFGIKVSEETRQKLRDAWVRRKKKDQAEGACFSHLKNWVL